MLSVEITCDLSINPQRRSLIDPAKYEWFNIFNIRESGRRNGFLSSFFALF